MPSTNAHASAKRNRDKAAIRWLGFASLAHSLIYTGLLIAWLTPGLHKAEFIFGLTHGLGWIAMSLASIAYTTKRIIPVRTAAAVAILGGIGPFFGTVEFFRLQAAKEAT